MSDSLRLRWVSDSLRLRWASDHPFPKSCSIVRPSVNGVCAIFTGSRECTRVNPRSSIPLLPGTAVGIPGSSTPRMSGIRAGREASEPAACSAFSNFHLRVLSAGLREKGDYLCKCSCQQLCCLGICSFSEIDNNNFHL